MVERENNVMTLDDWQKLAQIGFYVTVAAVSVLTFLRARKGLLNTVNTEYHKKAIERLDELSKTLLDEYDFESPNHWSKSTLGGDAVDALNEAFLAEKDAILKSGEFESGIIESPEHHRLRNLIQRIRSDPFIPMVIRNKVIDLLENRADVIIDVYLDELRKYRDELAAGTYKGDLENAKSVVHNRIIEGLRRRGCGISEVEQEVHRIRLAIQKYFDQFHP